MTPARLWHGGQLAAGWTAAVAGVVLLRFALIRGVYETVIEDQQLRRISGFWPEEMVTLITVLTSGIVVGVLAWLTASWFLGRRDRAALRANTVSVHRRILK